MGEDTVKQIQPGTGLAFPNPDDPAAPDSIPGQTPEQVLSNVRAGDRLFTLSAPAAFDGL
jgi:hypothetical protein